LNQICVVIATYNFFEMTRKCVELVNGNAGIGVDILVVDDGSSAKYIDPTINVIRIEKNSGATNAVNQGILWCGDRYKYIMLMDNDIIPEPDFIKHLYEHMESDAVTGIASSILYKRIDNKIHYGLFSMDLIDGTQAVVYECSDDLAAMYCDWLPLACCLVRTKMIRYIGILDRRFLHYCTDSDYCIRANLDRWNVAVIPKSRVEHLHQTTMRQVKPDTIRDQQFFIDKLAGNKLNEIFGRLPFYWGKNIWGRLVLENYAKELPNE